MSGDVRCGSSGVRLGPPLGRQDQARSGRSRDRPVDAKKRKAECCSRGAMIIDIERQGDEEKSSPNAGPKPIISNSERVPEIDGSRTNFFTVVTYLLSLK